MNSVEQKKQVLSVEEQTLLIKETKKYTKLKGEITRVACGEYGSVEVQLGFKNQDDFDDFLIEVRCLSTKKKDAYLWYLNNDLCVENAVFVKIVIDDIEILFLFSGYLIT